MENTAQKMEYPSKQIANKLWWNTLVIDFLISLILLFILGFILHNTLENSNGEFEFVLYNHISEFMPASLLIEMFSLIVAEYLAIKRISKKTIIKSKQVDEIVSSFITKLIIYSVIILIFIYFSNYFYMWVILSFVLEIAISILFTKFLSTTTSSGSY